MRPKAINDLDLSYVDRLKRRGLYLQKYARSPNQFYWLEMEGRDGQQGDFSGDETSFTIQNKDLNRALFRSGEIPVTVSGTRLQGADIVS